MSIMPNASLRLSFLTLLAIFFVADAAQAASELGMVTGPNNGTYVALGQDIAEVARTAYIVLTVYLSGGSIDNIKRLASGTEDMTLGIVQSDVLGFLARSKNPKSLAMAQNLRMIFPLHREEVHVLAAAGIRDFQDLQNKRVVVGDEGSGSLVTSVNLLAMMGVVPAETLRLAPAEGLLALLGGKADVMIYVGGKPVKLFKNLEALAQSSNPETAALMQRFHFLPMNDPRMLKEYNPATLTSEDYAWIEAPVPTIEVMAVLVSQDFSAPLTAQSKARCLLLGNLAQAMRTHLGWLKENGHPKWKEVDLDAKVGIWKRDLCSWQGGQTAAAPAQSGR